MSEIDKCFISGCDLHYSDVIDLLSLFVKNDWPIGYGIAQPIDYPGCSFGRNCAPVNFYIFPEFRGTLSTRTFFRLHLERTRERYDPSAFLVFRNLDFDAVAQMQRPDAQKDSYTRFLEEEGFRFLPYEDGMRKPIMFKEVG